MFLHFAIICLNSLEQMQSKRKTLKTHFIERYSASLLIGKRVLQEQTSFKRKTNINEQEQRSSMRI
jgi:hypothetical protein